MSVGQLGTTAREWAIGAVGASRLPMTAALRSKGGSSSGMAAALMLPFHPRHARLRRTSVPGRQSARSAARSILTGCSPVPVSARRRHTCSLGIDYVR